MKDGWPSALSSTGRARSVSQPGDDVRSTKRERALGQDRVAGERRVRPTYLIGAEDDLRVPLRGAPLGGAQVVAALVFEEVRSLDPDRLRGDIDAAVDEHLTRAHRAERGEVELLDPDRAVPLVQRCSFRRVVVQDVGPAVV